MNSSSFDTAKDGVATNRQPKPEVPTSTLPWAAVGGTLLLLTLLYVECRVFVYYEAKRTFDEFNQTMADLAKLDAYAMRWRTNSEAQDRAKPIARAFKLDRCIVGQRFNRKQISRPC
jgi:hypothetical protein